MPSQIQMGDKSAFLGDARLDGGTKLGGEYGFVVGSVIDQWLVNSSGTGRVILAGILRVMP